MWIYGIMVFSEENEKYGILGNHWFKTRELAEKVKIFNEKMDAENNEYYRYEIIELLEYSE